MTEKEKVIDFFNNPVLINGRNRMGCSENWYNPYFAIKETFSLAQIQSMTDAEVKNLVNLAQNIANGLY